MAETQDKPKAEPKPKQLKTTPARAAKKCRVEGCKRPYRAKGYCVTHYKLWRRGEKGKKQRYKICSKEGCRKPIVRWGLCQEHFDAERQGAAAAPAAS